MDSIQTAYEDLINRVFEYAYLDLVECLIKAKKERTKAFKMAVTRAQSEDHIEKAKRYEREAEWLTKWFEDSVSRWRNLDGKRFREWADEEVREYELTGIRRNHKRQPESEKNL